jgi:hypothetical protein
MLKLFQIAAGGVGLSVLALPMGAQAQGGAPPKNPFDQFDTASAAEEDLGPGPHTLIIWGGNGEPVTMQYASGRSCQRAKRSIASQTRPQRLDNGGAIFTAVTAICVPNG